MARNIYYWTIYVLCLTAYVTENTFYATVQGNVHLQINHLCYICSIHKYLQLMSLRAYFIQQLKAMYTCKSVTSVASVLFTNTAYVNDSTFYTTVHAMYTCNLHLQISYLCYICSVYKYLQLMSMTAHFIQQFKAMYTCNLHLQIIHLCYIFFIYNYCIMVFL